VVDGWGRVVGIDRLAVTDASVFPSSLGVNPQVTIMAFAERAAEGMLDRW
jgi:cholesterol oxidase